MARIAVADENGKIVIPHEVRRKLGEQYEIVEHDDRIELIPLTKNMDQALSEFVDAYVSAGSAEEIKQLINNGFRDDASEKDTESEH